MDAREELIREAEAMEPLPASCARLARLFSQDEWQLADIVSTIGLDQALTGRLLRLANSAAGGARQPVVSVAEAVNRVGSGSVLSLAMSSAMHAHMAIDLPAYGLPEGGLWKHSVGAALAVESLRASGLRPPPGSFVAGLVHDVGKLLLGRRMLREGRVFELRQGQSDAELLREEARQLGIDHASLGAMVARAWQLPAGIPEAIAFHHSPLDLADGPVRAMADLVAVADAVAHAVEEEHPVQADPSSCARIGAEGAVLERARELTQRLRDEVEVLYR